MKKKIHKCILKNYAPKRTLYQLHGHLLYSRGWRARLSAPVLITHKMQQLPVYRLDAYWAMNDNFIDILTYRSVISQELRLRRLCFKLLGYYLLNVIIAHQTLSLNWLCFLHCVTSLYRTRAGLNIFWDVFLFPY